VDGSFKKNFVWSSIFVLILVNVYLWQFIFSLDGNLKVVFFDVGQGDSIFIETPQGHQILIDGGPGQKVLTKLSKVMPFWDKSIDLVVLTHPDYDHLSGLVSALQRYQVDNIIWNGQESASKTFTDWQEAVLRGSAREFIGQRGLVIKAGKARFVTLWPDESSVNQLQGGSNDGSIVLLLNYGLNKFLFTGDITSKSEKALVSRDIALLKADVLKVAHHGSKYSTSKEFLAAVSPQAAIISCGVNNFYGHPHEEVLSNLWESAIKVLRTDQKGDIIITSNGSDFYYK